jgi:GntR family transcriptional regulator / MocR family aminotransferase
MLTYLLDSHAATPKYDQLYGFIRADILSGALAPGARMPSKRSLAEHLGVSVVTVETAYGRLVDEGYLLPRPRSGFFVCALGHPSAPAPSARALPRPEPEPPAPEIRGEFPLSTLARLYRQTLSARPGVLLETPPRMGCAVLRNALSGYLARYRGMTVRPEQIVVGAGAEYLYGLIVQLFGRDIVYGLEDPSYEKIRAVYRAHGATCEFLPIGPDGITDESLAKSRARVLHVTPFHSYPTGASAPAARRYAYLSWARERDAWLIEDDFDSEFSLGRKPLETLYAMAGGQSVVYLNTFSKSLSPALRVGYMVLPEALLDQFQRALGFYSCPVPVLDQYVLAEFISGGGFERHLNRVRRRLRQSGA